MSIDAPAKKSTAMTLKGGFYPLTAIQIITYDLVTLADELDQKIRQAPNFFHHAPLVIDLQMFPPTESIDFEKLVELLQSKHLVPIGVRGGTSTIRAQAIQTGLAVFPEEKKSTAKSLDIVSPSETRIITQPVRSGQQIYAPGGDLIILSSVSHGAEVLADGNIHVYGPLRGRALAGVMGNVNTMIFCKHLEAELVSIAGQYRLSEDLKAIGWKLSVCVALKAGRLNIVPI